MHANNNYRHSDTLMKRPLAQPAARTATIYWQAIYHGQSGTFAADDNSVQALVDKSFQTENESERKVFGADELLKDIFLLKRQVRGGNKTDIFDIVGVDSEGSVCIIEMKNTEVDADIIPQVLR